MSAAPRLTLHDQLLINLCGWLACTRFNDPNRAMMVAQAARAIPRVNHDHPLIGPLAEAAGQVIRHSDQPGAPDLARARLDLDAALQAVFYARAAQAAAAIWPEENTQPAAEEPANAAQ